jgi:hypothetical protein
MIILPPGNSNVAGWAIHELNEASLGKASFFMVDLPLKCLMTPEAIGYHWLTIPGGVYSPLSFTEVDMTFLRTRFYCNPMVCFP